MTQQYCKVIRRWLPRAATHQDKVGRKPVTAYGQPWGLRISGTDGTSEYYGELSAKAVSHSQTLDVRFCIDCSR